MDLYYRKKATETLKKALASMEPQINHICNLYDVERIRDAAWDLESSLFPAITD